MFSIAGQRPDGARHIAALMANGYVVIEGALAAAEIAAINAALDGRFARTPTSDGDFFGRNTRRFGGILKRAPATRALVMHPDILAAATAVLGPNCDRIQLSAAEACEVGAGEIAQVPYRDAALWPTRPADMECALTVVWPLTERAGSEGVMRVWPDSHGGAHAFPDSPIGPKLAPGSALLLLGSTMHGADRNPTSEPFRLVLVSYCLGWLKPYENQWLTYPRDIARGFDPALADVVGYRRERPNLGGVDGECPTRFLVDEPDTYVAARDALGADQAAALAAYREIQIAVEGYDE